MDGITALSGVRGDQTAAAIASALIGGTDVIIVMRVASGADTPLSRDPMSMGGLT
jgi:hypothetical protein